MRGTIIKSLFIGVVGLSLLAAPTMGTSAQKEEITLTAVAFHPRTGAGTTKLVEYIDLVNNRGKGKVFIKLLGGPEIAPVTEATTMVRDGVYDISYNTPSYYAGICPEANTAYYAFPANPVLLRRNGFYDIYKAVHRKAGLTFLGMPWRGGAFAVMSRKPIKSANFHGLKMATIPHVKDALAYLGASTVAITTMELYQAFERGVVDGCTIPHGLNPYEWKIHEVAPYMLEPPIPITAMSNFLVNSKRWDGLPPDVKKLLEDTMIEIELNAHMYYVRVAAEYNEKMVKEGMKYVSLPPNEAKKYIYAFSTYYWIQFQKRFPVWGPMLYEAVRPWISSE